VNARRILARAVEMAWRHKRLWLFGVLLAIFSGGYDGRITGQALQRAPAGELTGQLEGLSPEWILVIALFVLFWIALSIVVGHWATGALIGSLNDIEEGRVSGLSAGARTGLARFWTLLGITLAIAIPTALVALILLAPAIGLVITGERILTALGIGLACLVLPALVVLWVGTSLLLVLAQVAAVVVGTGVFASIRSAWQVIRDNLGAILLLWLVNTAAGCGWGCLGALILGAAVAAAVAGFLVSPVLGAALLVPAFIIFMLFLIGSGGLEVFYKAVWTLAYRQGRRLA